MINGFITSGSLSVIAGQSLLFIGNLAQNRGEIGLVKGDQAIDCADRSSHLVLSGPLLITGAFTKAFSKIFKTAGEALRLIGIAFSGLGSGLVVLGAAISLGYPHYARLAGVIAGLLSLSLLKAEPPLQTSARV